MAISNELYKKLLVKRAVGPLDTKILQVPKLASPLVTKFERWSGKRRKLYFENEQIMIAQGIKDFDLKNNVFASFLASPMRSERNGKIKMPKDFLIQLKLKKKQDEDNCKKMLELVPVVDHSKLNANSYVANSKELLDRRIKSASQWVPTPALTSSMRYFQMQDVDINRETFISGYEADIKRAIREEILGNSVQEMQLKNWDVLVCFEQNTGNNIEIRRVNLSEGNQIKVIMFNLKFGDNSLESLVNGKLGEHGLGMVLQFSKNERLIKLLYKMIVFYS